MTLSGFEEAAVNRRPTDSCRGHSTSSMVTRDFSAFPDLVPHFVPLGAFRGFHWCDSPLALPGTPLRGARGVIAAILIVWPWHWEGNGGSRT